MTQVRPVSVRLFWGFTAGAVSCPLLDGFHSHGNVLTYPHPLIWKMAWWVPLEFGLVGLAGAIAVPYVERRLSGDTLSCWSPLRWCFDVFIFPFVYLSTSIFGGYSAGLTLVLFAFVLLRLRFFRSQSDWLYVLALSILGPLGEIIISATGLFYYNHPDFLGIPFWLPALWAHAGIFARRLLVPLCFKSV